MGISANTTKLVGYTNDQQIANERISDMDFPEVERVIYKNSPLVEVLFQIRMPRELRLEQQLPVEFQQLVKNEYPILETRVEKISTEVAGRIEDVREVTLYDFRTSDRKWFVTLSSSFFALTTVEYTQWEEFRDRAAFIIDSVIKTYDPKIFTRIGLRYKDVIDRSLLGLSELAWAQLLSDNILGILKNSTSPEREAADLLEVHSTAKFAIDIGKATLIHGLVEKADRSEVGYLIDADYFDDEEQFSAEVDVAVGKLNGFNQYSRRVFRWCIGDSLHQAMGPTPPT